MLGLSKAKCRKPLEVSDTLNLSKLIVNLFLSYYLITENQRINSTVPFFSVTVPSDFVIFIL
jgi:hypothetical protein